MKLKWSWIEIQVQTWRMWHRSRLPGVESETRAGPCRRNQTRSQPKIRRAVRNGTRPATSRCTRRWGRREAAGTSKTRKRRPKRINIGRRTTQDAMEEEPRRFTNTRRVAPLQRITIVNSLARLDIHRRIFIPRVKQAARFGKQKRICETNIDATLGNIYGSRWIEPTVRYESEGPCRGARTVVLCWNKIEGWILLFLCDKCSFLYCLLSWFSFFF